MTFVAGNKRTLYLGTQSAKGTPQNVPTKALRVSDFTPDQVRTTLTLGETDRGTQQPSDVVTGITPGFTFKCYWRPSTAALLIASLLGDVVDTGSDPNYIHTISPNEATPYLTVFEDEPGVWCNKITDCRVTQIQLDGQAGGAIEATVTVASLGFTAGASAPTDPTPDSDLPYTYQEIAVTRGGVHAGTASQFSITIARNGNRAQGDNGPASLDYVNGLFSIVGQITKYASDDDDQRQVDTGSAAGTTPTTTIFSETLSIKATRDANTSTEFALAGVSWPTRAAAVATDGSPLAEVMGFRSLPQDDLADHVVVTVKDQLETVDG